MTCQVKQESIKHLIKEGAINKDRKIIKLDIFDKANYQLTEYAVRKYGLKTDGAMLFTNSVTEKIDKRASSDIRNAYYETARAIPNEVLFQELQVLIDQYYNVASTPTVLPKETTKELKPGIEELFNSIPELANIGTLEQYSQYLDSIFPDSKIKDIVYHGTYEKFNKFLKEKRGTTTGLGTYTDPITGEKIEIDSSSAFFFTNNKNAAISYGFRGRQNLIEKVERALESVSITIGRRMPIQEAVDYLKTIPYYNNLINTAKKENKSNAEIIELLKLEWQKVRKQSKKTFDTFSNWKNNNDEDINSVKTLLKNIDKLKANDPNINIRFGNFNETKLSRDMFSVYFDNNEYTFVSPEKRFKSKDVSTKDIENYLNSFLEHLLKNDEERKLEQKQAGYVENVMPAVINLKNPLTHDYEKSAFPDVYKLNEKYKTSYIAARQVKKALKDGNDGVIYENIQDPLLIDSYGVFEPEQIHLLGGEQDIQGFKNFVSGRPMMMKETVGEAIPLVDIDLNTINSARSKEVAEVLAERLSRGLKVDYENITPEDAKNILKNSPVPYRGEPAFYFGGKVYIVGDNVNVHTVLHEFSHPLLQGIRKTNPALFNNLYTQLAGTEEGQGIIEYVKKHYPELDPEGQLFKEEALAFALQLKSLNKVNNQIETEGFDNFINKLLAAIKQMLRGIFGNTVTVSKLDVDTTLDELADMLLEKDFEFETDKITEDDLVMYGRFVVERADELVKLSNTEAMQKVVNEVFATNKALLIRAKEFKTDKAVRAMVEKALLKEGTTELLPAIAESLRSYQDILVSDKLNSSQIIDNALDAEGKRLDEMRNRAIALVNSLDKINSISQNMMKDLSKIYLEKNINARNTIGLVNLYKNNAYAWQNTINEINNILSDFEIDTANPFYQVINEITTNLSKVQTKIADIYKKNNVQFFVEITGYMNEFVNNELKSNLGIALKKAFPEGELEKAVSTLYNSVIQQTLSDVEIDELVKKGVPKDILDKFIKKYNDYLVNEDKIKDALTGHAKDVSWFNRWLESYSSSNDIIVGPLSMFIQDQKTEVENEVWKKSMEFRKKLETLLPKVGFSKLDSTQIRDMVSGLDTIMSFDKKTGKPVAKEIYTFLNEFNNGWRYTQDLLEYNYEEAKKTGDKNAIAKALTELRQFNSDYMWQEFTPEFYEKDDIFKNSEIGGLAYVARKQALDNYNNIQNQFDKELERFDNYSTIEGAWRQYQQLYSFYYEDGSQKVDDPAKGIHDLSIAKLLLEHRQATRGFYEFIPIPGSLQTSYNEFVTLLEAQKITRGSAEFIDKLKKWKRQNIKVVYTDEYYAEIKRLQTRRQELQSRINEIMQSDFDISGAYQTIRDLIFSYKDELGQPNPDELGPERLKMIRDLEQEILDFKRKFDKKTGLTKEQSAELELLSEKAKRTEMNEAESKRYVYLLQLLKNAGIDIKEALELKGIFEELKSLSNKVPTEYYLDRLNTNLSKLDIKEVDEDTVDAFINTPDFQNIVDSDKNFREWFDLNHVITYRFNTKTKLEEPYYQRSAANSLTIPSNPKFYKTTTIVDTETGENITLMGTPNSRHSRFEVKNQYRTIPRGAVRQEYVGKYIDNKGNNLPRPFVPGAKNSAKDDKFIDKRYAQLKASNSAEYQLLEAMKEYHLQAQEGQSNYGKLYLDMPRYATKASDVYQIIQRGKYGERYKEMGKNIYEGLKQTFGNSVADNENGYNYNPENNLVNTDMAGNEISYIPVTGVYNLDKEVTDADVIQGIFKYSMSLQTQGKLLESLPLVESILSTLEDPANKPKNVDRFSKAAFNVRNKLQNTNKQGAENNRLGQVRSLLEREYYGKQVVGLEENYPRLGKWLGVLQKLSSRGSLMLNIPSDIKNQFSGYIQTIIEGSGGEFITLKDIALATPWATKAMLDWTTKGIYQVGPGEMSTQLVEIFDPTFKAEDSFGRSVTRSLAKDLVNGEWLYMHRKFGEMDVAMKLFGSFLHGQKIDQTLSNGKKISIRYVDAWEKDANGVAKLKDGIHPGWNNTAVYHTYTKGETLEQIAKKYNIDLEELQAKNHIKSTTQLEDGQEIIIAKSEKFKAFKNKMQGTSRRLFGVYDKFGQPEGNKYIMYRMFFFMRKWFTPMLVNRFGMDVSKENFGGARYDWALGKTTKGYYVNAFQTLVGLLKSKGSSYAYMTPQEKTDLKRTMSEGLTIIMTALLASALLGFDDDDEDKWKKIAARSEAIGQEGFNTYGFLTNHALLLILGLQAETGAFVPLPKVFGLNLGADDYTKMITSTSSAFYNTVILYTEIFGDFLNFITLDDAARYKKDTGPYWWQQKDELKIWKRLFSTVGFTGGTGDPETAIKNISKSSGKLR